MKLLRKKAGVPHTLHPNPYTLFIWSAADAEVLVKLFVSIFPMTLEEFESLKPENLQQYDLLMKTTPEELQLWYNLAKVLDDCWKRAIISSAIFEQTYIMEASIPF